MDDTALQRFAALVAEVALEEELSLRRAAGEGIFFMPELAFAFAVGRAAASHSDDIFGEPGWKWQRERQVGDEGPVDLMFAKGESGPRVLVEFKMRDTTQKYQADIEKLERIGEAPDRLLFCVTMDVWADSPFEDPRYKTLKARLRDPILSPTTFTTKQDRYERQIACLIGVWEVTAGKATAEIA